MACQPFKAIEASAGSVLPVTIAISVAIIETRLSAVFSFRALVQEAVALSIGAAFTERLITVADAASGDAIFFVTNPFVTVLSLAAGAFSNYAEFFVVAIVVEDHGYAAVVVSGNIISEYQRAGSLFEAESKKGGKRERMERLVGLMAVDFETYNCIK